jgi:histidinol-phosphatase (PHP family)
MLSNYHTHSCFCDGKSTPEEIVLSAIDKGLFAIGFSGHGYTSFDLSYCMKDTDGYIQEIKRLKDKYKSQIEIYLGVEEDAFAPVNRECFDYILGSSHYVTRGGVYYPIDSHVDCMEKCISAFGGDALKLAEQYFATFSDYIKRRRPDIIGHLDLLTKYDEVTEGRFLNNPGYFDIAKKYTSAIADLGCIFEVNTCAISRGYRAAPYPHEELLYIIRKKSGKVMLNSDSHSAETLISAFDDAMEILRDIGFKKLSVIKRGGFTEIPL